MHKWKLRETQFPEIAPINCGYLSCKVSWKWLLGFLCLLVKVAEIGDRDKIVWEVVNDLDNRNGPPLHLSCLVFFIWSSSTNWSNCQWWNTKVVIDVRPLASLCKTFSSYISELLPNPLGCRSSMKNMGHIRTCASTTTNLAGGIMHCRFFRFFNQNPRNRLVHFCLVV